MNGQHHHHLIIIIIVIIIVITIIIIENVPMVLKYIVATPTTLTLKVVDQKENPQALLWSFDRTIRNTIVYNVCYTLMQIYSTVTKAVNNIFRSIRIWYAVFFCNRSPEAHSSDVRQN